MIRTIAIVLAALTLMPAAADAHRLDEYLHASRIALARDAVRVEMDLTPGVSVARDVVTLIDRNGNGQIDGHEAEAYGRAIVSDLLLMVDARRQTLVLHHVDIAPIGELTDGVGTIRITASAQVATARGRHHLTLRHDHQAAGAVFLVNMLVPDARGIVIRSQSRDVRQRELRVDYEIARAGLGTSTRKRRASGTPLLQVWWLLAACATLGTLSVRRLKAPRPRASAPR